MKKKNTLSIRVDERTTMLLNELSSLTGKNISVLSRVFIMKGLNDMLDNEGYIKLSARNKPKEDEMKTTIDKAELKKQIIYNVKTLYRKTIDEATPQQVFQAVSYAVKDVIIDDWIATQKAYDEADAKTVYYMSMEFLMGRALGNNLINLTAYKEVKEALEEMEIDLNVIEDQEPDAALGNGGQIGRAHV